MTDSNIDIIPHDELYGPIERPNRWFIPGEAAWVIQPFRALVRFPSLVSAPRGNGQRILTLPGLMAGDLSMKPIRDYLWFLGYKPEGWGLGRNLGNVDYIVPRLLKKIEKMVEEEGGPIVVVGWSMGGILAREIARERPELIRYIITLGSPVIGGPKFTTVAFYYEVSGADVDQLASDFDQRYKTPLTTPVTAFYSKTDRIVAWEACIDRRSEHIEHIEVGATHLGFGHCPEVLQTTAKRLATVYAGEPLPF